jgi:hypothetical protein
MQITQDTINQTGGTAASDLEEAFNAIRNKRSDLDLLFSYYDGPQPLKYSTNRLAELFQNINTHFEQNWMSVVVDATLDRLQLTGFTTKNRDAAADEKFKMLFDRLHLDIEADKAHQASLTTSQAYVIVWQDAGETVAYYNDPRMCHVFYEDANPRKKRFAAKWFSRTDGSQEITLYYTDRIEHWLTQKQRTGTSVDKVTAFAQGPTETNTYGVIPVFELHSPGEIFKVLSSQDAINKLFADMMVAAEFGAVMQRYVISNSDPGALKNAPNEIWWIPAGDGVGQAASVGQFQATVLSNFSAEMDKIANHIFINTRTPKHYLMVSGSNISGEALLAMESPLNKKSKKRQTLFASQWQDIASFIAQLEGMTVTPDDIACQWERIESLQPKTEAETRQVNVNAGIPLITILRRDGWSDEEIEQMDKDQATQDKARQTMAQAVLNDLRIRQQQENPQDNQDVTNNANNA